MTDAQASMAAVTVVGGGLVGACAALAAAAPARPVRLVDAGRPVLRPGRFGHDLRTVALSPVSQDLLTELNVPIEGSPFSRMVIWEERGTARLQFDSADLGRASLGTIVAVGATVERLWQALDAHPAIEVVDDFAVDHIERIEDGLRLEAGPRSLTTRQLVAADGVNSSVRRLLSIGSKRQPTGHNALVTMVRCERPHGGTAYQCFLRDGPVALLPGPEDDLCSVVWSQSQPAAEALGCLDDASFGAALARAVDHCLGAVQAVDQRVVVPLEQLVVDDFMPQPNVIVIGDAARVLHPMAGQGVNLGLEDVAMLRELLVRGTTPELLRTFARRRRLRAQAMTTLMKAFQQIYGARNPLFGLLRNTGVSLLEASPSLKTQLVREAMGIGPVAQLSRRLS